MYYKGYRNFNFNMNYLEPPSAENNFYVTNGTSLHTYSFTIFPLLMNVSSSCNIFVFFKNNLWNDWKPLYTKFQSFHKHTSANVTNTVLVNLTNTVLSTVVINTTILFINVTLNYCHQSDQSLLSSTQPFTVVFSATQWDHSLTLSNQ